MATIESKIRAAHRRVDSLKKRALSSKRDRSVIRELKEAKQNLETLYAIKDAA